MNRNGTEKQLLEQEVQGREGIEIKTKDILQCLDSAVIYRKVSMLKSKYSCFMLYIIMTFDGY